MKNIRLYFIFIWKIIIKKIATLLFIDRFFIFTELQELKLLHKTLKYMKDKNISLGTIMIKNNKFLFVDEKETEFNLFDELGINNYNKDIDIYGIKDDVFSHSFLIWAYVQYNIFSFFNKCQYYVLNNCKVYVYIYVILNEKKIVIKLERKNK